MRMWIRTFGIMLWVTVLWSVALILSVTGSQHSILQTRESLSVTLPLLPHKKIYLFRKLHSRYSIIDMNDITAGSSEMEAKIIDAVELYTICCWLQGRDATLEFSMEFKLRTFQDAPWGILFNMCKETRLIPLFGLLMMVLSLTESSDAIIIRGLSVVVQPEMGIITLISTHIWDYPK